MTTKNEITETNNFDIITSDEKMVREDENFVTYQNQVTGKFSRKMKYKDYSSIVAETREQKISLLQLKDNAIEMKKVIDKKIKVGAVIMEAYTQLDEDTGTITQGATTTIISDDYKKCYVTSSKSFYIKMQEAIKLFGSEMFNEGEELQIVPVKKKGTQFEYTTFEYAE